MLPLLSEPRRALLIANARARRGESSLDAVVAGLAASGIDVEIARHETRDDVSADIFARRDALDAVIVAGGDGTVNAAAEGLMATGLPLGILPFGTANDLARTLTIPFDAQRAAEVIVRGKIATIDVGTVNDLPFFNVASIGLSAKLAQTITPGEKRRFGRFGYAFAALRVLASARPFRAWITNQGETVKVRTLQIAVGNGRHYGGGNVVERTARIDDGTLDLYSLEIENVWKLALMARAFRTGEHGAWEQVRTKRCVEFDVATRRPRSVNVDGDVLTATPAHFRIAAQAVRVFVP